MAKKNSVENSSVSCVAPDSSLKILAVDTSTSMASVCIMVNRKVVCESLFCADRTLSARLVPEIERLAVLAGIPISDIDLFAASTGPGSFTGVRGGVATIQGLALASGKSCVGFSSLAMLAMNFPFSSHPVCSMLDARKNEVYAGLYDCSQTTPVPIIKDCVLPPAALLEMICEATSVPVVFAGDGALRFQALIMDRFEGRALMAPLQHHTSRAANGALLALEAEMRSEAVIPSKLLPVYLRASEAEINRKLRLQAQSGAV